jgi:hypothetical protein
MSYVTDRRLGPQEQSYIFQVQGTVYHYQGPLCGGIPAFAQLYFLDPQSAVNIRLESHPSLEDLRLLLTDLDALFRTQNPFHRLFHRARDVLEAHADLLYIRLNPQLRLTLPADRDPRRYNLPSVNHELAAVIPDIPAEFESSSYRDIYLYRRHAPVIGTTTAGITPGSHFLTKIQSDHALYLPLHYVLFFPLGGRGYHCGLTLAGSTAAGSSWLNTKLSPRMFYRFHLHTRQGVFETLHRGALLFQQFVVDAWASTEQMHLQYLRFHQKQIRADLYNSVLQALDSNSVSLQEVGRRVVLPTSFVGGDRFMQRLYQDSMAIVRHFGRPALFITFTANPHWDEITRELLNDEMGVPMQTWRDRPDLVARVFHLKIQAFLHEVRYQGVFGHHVASVYTVEYQKRGLPHMHFLLFLAKDAQLDTVDRIDNFISAEIPDPSVDGPLGRELYEIVTRVLIHRPCGDFNPKSPCMKQRHGDRKPKCSKQFPKPFRNQTVIPRDSYPEYRRRSSGPKFIAPHPTQKDQTIEIGNEWVVPYNPYLTWRYKAHINVEVCGTIRAVKYIHKYIYKGGDRTTIEMQTDADEIKQYTNARYIGASEGVWRLFEFPVHGEVPSVKPLPVHLPGQHQVSFDSMTRADSVAQSIETQRSALMAFFDYNAAHPETRSLLYQDFPGSFTWRATIKEWKPRAGNTQQIGRIYQINPFQGELYYLRRLLTVVPGPISFEDLRTVDGRLCTTFQEACYARGIVSSDTEWEDCFNEAKDLRTGWHLRRLLLSAMLYGGLHDAASVWLRFGDHICDDLAYHLRRENLQCDPSIQHPNLDYGLYLIERALQAEDRQLADFNLPAYQHDWGRDLGNPYLRAERDYDRDGLARSATIGESLLNAGQRAAYQRVLDLLRDNPNHAQFFLYGPAGTGKTFLYTTLCSRLRSQGKIVLCVASTGIAALLLPGGRTAHKRFKIPFNVSESTTCFISRRTHLAELLCHTDLIIWDETPMTNRDVFNAVDRTLRDIRGDLPGGDRPFGGIPIILGGDFQQILPVVPKGDRPAIVAASLQFARVWPHLKLLTLHENMRLAAAHDDFNREFAAWLSVMSHSPPLIGPIRLPHMIYHTSSIDTFIDRIYPAQMLHNAHLDPQFFVGRAILTPCNRQVDELNDLLLQCMQGDLLSFDSYDEADLNDNAAGREELTAEFLHSLNAASLPRARLDLRLGAPVILLRNLDPDQGLCNGTRLTVSRATRRCLEVRIIGGDFDRQHRLIYRCKLSTSEGLHFTLTRLQFPIRLAFAMTINKSQGQSLRYVGIDLRRPVFTHGQLYVAFSRSTNVHDMAVLLDPSNADRITDNVVYPEVLYPFYSRSAGSGLGSSF